MCRPQLEIDWDKVDELLTSGCLGTEVAAYLGIHPDTFYRRIKEKFDMGFTDFMQEKRAKGDSILRAHQFAKALGLTDKGDNTLLIWLGKCRLRQRDTDQPDISPNQDALSKDDINFKLQAENALLKQKLSVNDNQ